MKKLLIFIFLLNILLLTSCVNESNEDLGEVYIEPDPVLVDDEELMTYDELPIFYNNKMTMPNGSDSADPFIMRYNGYYYLYATNGSRNLLGYKSNDLYLWEPVDNGVLNPGYVYDYNADPSSPGSPYPYAPEVIYFNGKFYMITSPSGNGHFVLESDSPEGPFVNVSGNIGLSIDGHYFIDGKDENIYLFTSLFGCVGH